MDIKIRFRLRLAISVTAKIRMGFAGSRVHVSPETIWHLADLSVALAALVVSILK